MANGINDLCQSNTSSETVTMQQDLFKASNGVRSTGCVEKARSASEGRDLAPRGYPAGFGYPFLPFLEPLTILAVLGFIAFIVQTLHAIYHTHTTHAGGGGGVVGGLLNNVLPGTVKAIESEARDGANILHAIQLYDNMNQAERNRSFKQVKMRPVVEKIT